MIKDVCVRGAYLVPLGVLLGIWQVASSLSAKNLFLVSSPWKVGQVFVGKCLTGELLYHSWITGIEAFTGFFLGVTIGSGVGFALLYFPRVAEISKFYIVALGAVPIFAFAPLMIIWFGISIKMKIAMAFFSTVLVALAQAYEGGKNVDEDLRRLFELYNSSRSEMFKKLIFPASLGWVFSSFKLCIGAALLGAFIGEFIASERGLGYAMLKASGVYDVTYVFAASICIMILALILNSIVKLFEKHQRRIIQIIAVPKVERENR